MEDHTKNSPRKLDISISFGARSVPVWVYDSLPPGMVPATLPDLLPGRPLLHLVRVGPDAGKYYSCIYYGSYVAPIREAVRRGGIVYVKK